MATISDVDKALKAMNVKDLRTELRARGLQPGGGEEELRQRLKEALEAGGSRGFVDSLIRLRFAFDATRARTTATFS